MLNEQQFGVRLTDVGGPRFKGKTNPNQPQTDVQGTLFDQRALNRANNDSASQRAVKGPLGYSPTRLAEVDSKISFEDAYGSGMSAKAGSRVRAVSEATPAGDQRKAAVSNVSKDILRKSVARSTVPLERGGFDKADRTGEKVSIVPNMHMTAGSGVQYDHGDAAPSIHVGVGHPDEDEVAYATVHEIGHARDDVHLHPGGEAFDYDRRYPYGWALEHTGRAEGFADATALDHARSRSGKTLRQAAYAGDTVLSYEDYADEDWATYASGGNLKYGGDIAKAAYLDEIGARSGKYTPLRNRQSPGEQAQLF